ncbi:25091_t:CDS:1, partial [Gigaspora rosea]
PYLPFVIRQYGLVTGSVCGRVLAYKRCRLAREHPSLLALSEIQFR